MTAVDIIARLRVLDQTVAVAESLTGGLVSAELTRPPGASQVVLAGLVVYTSVAKVRLAGVDDALLRRVGAVHPDVARALASNVRDLMRTDYGIGLTGVAGPAQQDGRPVGEVHLCVIGPLGLMTVSRDFSGLAGRDRVRMAATQAAIDLLDSVSREATR